MRTDKRTNQIKSHGPDYSRNDPKGWCGDMSRGAALGRATIDDVDKEYSGHLYLQKVTLNSGGYDRNGTYFGTGKPLYWVSNQEGTVDRMLRAWGRVDARNQVLTWYPKAKVRA